MLPAPRGRAPRTGGARTPLSSRPASTARPCVAHRDGPAPGIVCTAARARRQAGHRRCGLARRARSRRSGIEERCDSTSTCGYHWRSPSSAHRRGSAFVVMADPDVVLGAVQVSGEQENEHADRPVSPATLCDRTEHRAPAFGASRRLRTPMPATHRAPGTGGSGDHEVPLLSGSGSRSMPSRRQRSSKCGSDVAKEVLRVRAVSAATQSARLTAHVRRW